MNQPLLSNQKKPSQLQNEIQSFGYLIGISKENKTIQFFSENIDQIFAIDKDKLINSSIGNLLNLNDHYLNVCELEEGEFLRIERLINNRLYNINFYHFNEFIYIEFEKNPNGKNDLIDYHNKAEKVLYSNDIFENWHNLIDAIYELTNYDQIVIYKNLEEGGEVIAEKKIDELESLMGLQFNELEFNHYTKEVFKAKKNHIILDNTNELVPIRSNESNLVDLLYSEFRPIPVGYRHLLKKSMFKSRFCNAIVVNNNVWGYVAGFNLQQKYIPTTTRNQTLILTRIARLNYVNFQSDRKIAFQSKFTNLLIDLKQEIILNDLSISDDLLDKILQLSDAHGIAFIDDKKIFKAGNVPQNEQILSIKKWGIQNIASDLYVSNSFYRDYHNILDINTNVGGLIIKKLDKNFRNAILLFKKVESPNLILEDKLKSINPKDWDSNIKKHSSYLNYDAWKINTSSKAINWDDSDLYLIKEISTIILESINAKALKINELYKQLKEINTELDTFSYTISHDLRTPLTVMKLNCQLLQRKLTDDIANNKIKEIITEIDNISEMMEEILQLSKAKKSDIKLMKIETTDLISKLSVDCKQYYKSDKTNIVSGILLPILADKTMAYQIFLNIINNAIKYSSKQLKPIVEINSVEEDNHVIYYVSDNGIGIKDEDKDKMFKLFSRMSNTSEYRGNGVGLSIVSRMMERLDGEITFESKVNIGTKFRLKFKKPLENITP